MNPYASRQNNGTSYYGTQGQLQPIQPLGNTTGQGPVQQNPQSPLYFSNPNIKINTAPVTPYKSQYNEKDPISALINKIGSMLQPQKAFSQDVMSYDTYANPQRAVFNQWAGDYKREFDRFTLDPFKRQSANMMAGTGMNQMGNAQANYQTNLRQTEQPFYNQLESARNSYEDMLRQGYNKQLTGYYDSPTAFNNIGTK